MSSSSSDRFQWLEWPDREFPFVDGVPARFSGPQWLLVMAMVAAGFLVVALPIPWPGGAMGQFIPAVLMPALPLLGVHLVARGQWKVLFGSFSWREAKLVLLFAALNIAVSVCVGLTVKSFVEVQGNPAIAILANASTVDKFWFFAKTLPQLLGEEVITVLPFLALMVPLSRYGGAHRKTAIVGAWLLSALMFGLMHLPTYGWNVVQCVVIIGTARLVLTLPWIMTKNLWVSTGAHILNDWTMFGVAMLATTAQGAAR
nr:type II CAAX endopeptidase family protein [uncultured Rhodoferax sp.]